jgi:hypothetical protein
VALHFFAKYIKIQVFNFSYQVEHIIYGNLEVFYFFKFFIIFYYFITNLKSDPRGGGVTGKIDHYPWRIRKGAPGVSPYPRRIGPPFTGGSFSNSNFIFQILNYYPRHTGSQFASDIPIYPQRISGVFAGDNGE